MNMKYILHFIVVILYVLFVRHSCESAKILVVLPTSLKSHSIVFNSVIDILATKHDITFYSVHKLNKNYENVTERRISNDYVNTNIIHMISEMLKHDAYYQLVCCLRYCKDSFEQILAGDDINDLIISTERYDLFITLNMFSEALFKLSHKLKTPLVQLAPSIPLPWTNDAIGIRNNYGYDLSFFTYETPNTFLGRMKKFVKQIYVVAYYEWVYLPALENMSKKYFPPDTPTIKEIARNTEGLLVNYISSMGYVQPTPPNVLEIGGLHCKRPKSLPTDLEQFVSASGENGVIFFSLGSTVSDMVLSIQIKLTILNVFKKLPQRILWKLDEEITDLPANIKVSKWFPQQDILGHNKTKLFITQGGMLSLQEAAYYGIPVLIYPLISDQFTNGYLAEKKGYGKMLAVDKFEENTFYRTIQELINNPRYLESAKQISLSIKYQPVSTAEKLKHWIDYIILHRNSSPFQSETKNLSHMQLAELDIVFTLVAIIILIVICSIYVCLTVFKIINNCFCKQNIKYKQG